MKNDKKDKKVGIMTLFNCYNYGAVLQAYATYKYVKMLGYTDVELIDYENKFEAKSKKTLFFIFSGNIKHIIKKIIQYIILGKNRNLKKAFKSFCDGLEKSNKKYKNIEELKNTNYDILISGSDQIWNPVIFGTLDKVYLLDFSNTAKKIAISSSAGSYKFQPKEKQEVVECLKKFDGIAVREETLKKQLENDIQDIFVSIDPTLLLTEEEWCQSLEANNKYNENNSEYVLLYIVDANLKTYLPEIRKLKEKIKKDFWLITPYTYKMECIDRNIVKSTPNDFISLFKNASMVITNSFHGVIFSSNFNKKFIALENHKNPVRAKDYLNKIGIPEIIVKNEKEAEDIELEKINWNYYHKLEEVVKETKKWIGDKIG